MHLVLSFGTHPLCKERTLLCKRPSAICKDECFKLKKHLLLHRSGYVYSAMCREPCLATDNPVGLKGYVVLVLVTL